MAGDIHVGVGREYELGTCLEGESDGGGEAGDRQGVTGELVAFEAGLGGKGSVIGQVNGLGESFVEGVDEDTVGAIVGEGSVGEDELVQVVGVDGDGVVLVVGDEAVFEDDLTPGATSKRKRAGWLTTSPA
jgi:hypothetical protein